MDRYDEIMAKEAKAALIVCVDIEHISGKEAMELVKQRIGEYKMKQFSVAMLGYGIAGKAFARILNQTSR